MQGRNPTQPLVIKNKETKKKRITETEKEQAQHRNKTIANPLFFQHSLLSTPPNIVIPTETAQETPKGSPHWNNFSNEEAKAIIEAWGSSDESGEGHSPVSQFPVDQSPPATPLLVSPREPEKSLVINEKPCSARIPSVVKKPPNKPFQFFGCCGCEDSSEEERTKLTVKGISKS